MTARRYLSGWVEKRASERYWNRAARPIGFDSEFDRYVSALVDAANDPERFRITREDAPVYITPGDCDG